jgi:Heterokaryon incompatibility protein (HET)
MAMASEWLWKCVDSHDCSAPGTNRTKLLTRFIDIGNSGGIPRLVERKPEDLPRHWIALSYRWGREPSQKLTKSSINRLKQGIDLQGFDATIRDAILIARGLEIQHLWVDALCIFQDDESDWSKQSSQMTEIYGRSTVTLVPVSSQCVSQGFLMSRNQRYLAVPWRMPEYHGENNQNSVLRQVYLSEFRSREDRLEGPWSERGWTLQEGLLPQRVLFYTSKQMVWKCGRETLYERGIRKEPLLEVVRGILDEPGGRPFWDLDLFTKWKLLRWYVQGPECRKSDDKYLIWHSLIEDYSTRQFSRPQDRLVAISGLAQSYGDVIGDDQYCAGLWKQDMIRGLLWRTPGAMLFDASIAHRKVVGNVVSPSWSWVEAASTFPIRNDWAHIMDFQKKAAIENVNSSLVETSNPFGNVTCASISISGPILQFTKLYHDDWQSQSAQLTAFERHISRIIEHDYSERAQEFSHQGHYAALLMLQEFPSFDHRVDVLLLQSVAPLVDTGVMEARRLGVITLSYISENLTTSPSILRSVKKHENSAYRRLNPEKRPRRMKRLHCEDVFQEYAQKPWSHQTVRIV